MRAGYAAFVGMLLIAVPAFAGPYSAQGSRDGHGDGAIYRPRWGNAYRRERNTGSILVHPTRTGIFASAHDQCSGSGYGVNESKGLIEFTGATGWHTDCEYADGIADSARRPARSSI